MVTNAAPVIVRVPHPVQAGVLTATLWIFRRLLSLAFLLGILWAIPVAIADYPENISLWAAGILGAALLLVVVSTVLGRIQQNRVPGALRYYSWNEIPRTSRIPTAIANLAEAAVVIAALPYLLAHSDSYGVLAGILSLLGGGMLALAVSNAAAAAWYRLPGWKSATVWRLLNPLPLAITLTYAGLVVAPEPNRGASAWFLTGIIMVGVAKAAEAAFRVAKETATDTLDDAADALTERGIAAPTLRDRARSRVMVRAAAIGGCVLFIALACFIASF